MNTPNYSQSENSTILTGQINLASEQMKRLSQQSATEPEVLKRFHLPFPDGFSRYGELKWTQQQLSVRPEAGDKDSIVDHRA